MEKILTLCIIHRNSSILLGMKKRGFGEGHWNGFGGKLNLGETIEDAAKREIKEEIDIMPLDIKRRGILNFKFKDSHKILKVHIFSVSTFEGEPTETEEMRPQWFEINKIPYDKMWPADKHWLPILLKGKTFEGDFYYQDNKTLLSHQIKEL